jgi:hypothetical protein
MSKGRGNLMVPPGLGSTYSVGYGGQREELVHEGYGSALVPLSDIPYTMLPSPMFECSAWMAYPGQAGLSQSQHPTHAIGAKRSLQSLQ